MKILSIDPASNYYESSTTGIVLLDNAKLLNYWVVPFGTQGFKDWYDDNALDIDVDVVVIEKYEARDNDRAKDNSVLDTIAYMQDLYPNAILQRNVGYKTDIPDDLLKLLNLWRFDKSHHQDVRAAARLGLFWAMRNDVEEVLTDIGRIAIKELASRSD